MKNLFVFVVLLALAGCASMHNATKVTNKGIKEGHGLVVAQVAINTPKVGRYFDYWHELIIYKKGDIPEGESAVYSLYQVPDNTGSVKSYIGQIPPGEYYVGKLWSSYSTDSFYTYMSMPISLTRSLVVSAGKTTHAGTYIYQPLSETYDETALSLGWFEREKNHEFPAYVTYVDAPYKSSEMIINEQQRHLAKLTSTRSEASKKRAKKIPKKFVNNGSKPESQDKSESKLFNLSLPHAAASGPLLRYNGRIYQPSKLGVVKIFSDDAMEIKRLPTLEDVVGLALFERGMLAITKDYRLFALKVDEIEEIKDTTWGKPLALASNGGLNFAIFKNELGIEVLSIPNLNISEWKSLGRFDDIAQIDNVYIGLRKQLGVEVDGYLYQYAKEGWSKHESAEMEHVLTQPDGNLVALEPSFFGSTKSLAASFDNGLSWETRSREIDNALYLLRNSKPFVTSERFYALNTPKSEKTKTPYFTEYNNKKPPRGTRWASKWKSISQIDTACYDIASEVSRLNSIYLICEGGALQRSVDGGQTWHAFGDITLSSLRSRYENLVEDLKGSLDKETNQ